MIQWYKQVLHSFKLVLKSGQNTGKTHQPKNKVINNAVALYNNYFDSYKKSFNEICNKTFDETTLDEIKTYDPYKFKIENLLPEWLESKNDFNEAKRLMISQLTWIKSKQVKRIKSLMSWIVDNWHK